jgi:sphingomyelin phosphodiesterase 2
MTERHEELKCSLSDHFSIETTLIREQSQQRTAARSQSSETSQTSHADEVPMTQPLSVDTYRSIQLMISQYMLRERKQRKWREWHFLAQVGISVACLIGVWWSPNYVAFILMLISTLGLSAGVLDGLMGFLFVKGELRALKEFHWDIDEAAKRAEALGASGHGTYDGKSL